MHQLKMKFVSYSVSEKTSLSIGSNPTHGAQVIELVSISHNAPNTQVSRGTMSCVFAV